MISPVATSVTWVQQEVLILPREDPNEHHAVRTRVCVRMHVRV